MVGLSESTVCKIFIEVYNAMLNFWKDAVDSHFPKSVDDFWKKLQKIECEWQFHMFWLQQTDRIVPSSFQSL